MTRHFAWLLLPLLGAGCVEMDVKLREPSSRPIAPFSAPASPITADQVNAGNARRMADALWEEMDIEELPPPVTSRTKK